MMRAAISHSAADDDHTADRASDPAICMAERDAIQSALNRLDEPHRLPLLMVAIEGMGCREVATALDLPLGTVLSRLHRARQRLEGYLEDAANNESRRAEDEAMDRPAGRISRGGSA